MTRADEQDVTAADLALVDGVLQWSPGQCPFALAAPTPDRSLSCLLVCRPSVRRSARSMLRDDLVVETIDERLRVERLRVEPGVHIRQDPAILIAELGDGALPL